MLWGDVVCDVVWGGMIDLKLFVSQSVVRGVCDVMDGGVVMLKVVVR